MSVRLPVRMEQLGCRWKDFYEILHLRIFRKSVENIQILLTSDKNNAHLHEDLCIFMVISSCIILKMRIFRTNFVDNTKYTFYFQ